MEEWANGNLMKCIKVPHLGKENLLQQYSQDGKRATLPRSFSPKLRQEQNKKRNLKGEIARRVLMRMLALQEDFQEDFES